MDRNGFLVGYLFGRRGFKRWNGREPTRPKMPSRHWRTAAVVCTLAGVLVAWLIFRSGSGVGWRMLAGGMIGLAVGMYVVETIWERRVATRGDQGPIGPRR